jgi:ankyrin repeat protein
MILNPIPRKHVFSDLQPYTCTFETCTAKPFTDRHSWFNHELKFHRKEWVCSLCEHSPFQSPQSFQNHIQSRHREAVTENQLPTMTALCEESVDCILPGDCPLCNDWIWTIRHRENLAKPDQVVDNLVVTPVQFRRHLGRHLEQLALFTLPRITDQNEDNLGSNDAVVDASANEGSMSNSVETANGEPDEDIISLHEAVAVQNEEQVRSLLKSGADANGHSHAADIYPIHTAATRGNKAILRLLLEHGADVNAIDGFNQSPLHRAIQLRRKSIAELLLEFGADASELAGPDADHLSVSVHQYDKTPSLDEIYPDRRTEDNEEEDE